MIRGQMFRDPEGRLLQFVEAWSPDGIGGTPRRIHRVRYTFLDVATRKYVDLWDEQATTVVPEPVGA